MRQENFKFTGALKLKEKPKEKRIDRVGEISEELRKFHNEVRQYALNERSVALRGIEFGALNEMDREMWEKWKRGKLTLADIEADRRILGGSKDVEEAMLMLTFISGGVVPTNLNEDQQKLYENLKDGKVTRADVRRREKAREEMKGLASASVQLLNFLETRIKRDRHP